VTVLIILALAVVTAALTWLLSRPRKQQEPVPQDAPLSGLEQASFELIEQNYWREGTEPRPKKARRQKRSPRRGRR
jgi:hypothetical protein